MFDVLKEKDKFKISFLDTFVTTYKILSDVQIKAKEEEKSLLTCERGRARALADLLHAKYNTTGKPVLKQKSLQLDDVKSITRGCDSCLVFYDIHVRKLTARFWVIASESDSLFCYDEKAENRTLNETLQFAELILKSGIDSEEEIKKKIKKGYFECLVEQSVRNLGVRDETTCEDRSLAFLQCEDHKRFTPETTTGPSETSCDLPRNVDLGYVDDDNNNTLEILFDKLVSPVVEKLTKEEVVIIPDGPLFRVPFAALQDPETGKFLSETKRLRLAPSLTTLKLLQDSSDDQHCKSGALIVGDPDVGKVMYKGSVRENIPKLPGARHEAEEIGQILGVKPLVGGQATKETILNKLQNGVSVIHFAAHGSAQNGEILLAPSRPSSADFTPEERDYMLTMKEAQESGIRAQLVVLSCCHSGRGEIKAEGVVGMTRAFLAAGARAVVASLWAIHDSATKKFMTKFYSHLKNGKSASESLNLAMKEMREIEQYKHPYFWAAFFLIGDDVTITV